MNKRTETAFCKKVYLLGQDTDGYTVWLEEPSWDCGHYWGFGYIERYTNKLNPQNAKGINSHTHWDSSIVGKDLAEDGKYCHHLNQNKNFKQTTLTDAESWKLAELMQIYYTLEKASALFEDGSAGISTISNRAGSGINTRQKNMYKRINEGILPKVFKEIDLLLSPKVEGTKE